MISRYLRKQNKKTWKCSVLDPAPFVHYVLDMYYVYLIKSLKSNNWYIGYTNDIEKKIKGA